MMNFWQATPSDVLRSIGDGDADDDAEHDEENDEFGRGDSPVNCGLRFRSPPVMGDCGWVKGWIGFVGKCPYVLPIHYLCFHLFSVVCLSNFGIVQNFPALLRILCIFLFVPSV